MSKPKLDVPWIDYETLRQRADEFRRRFDVTEVVCPIERIAEFGLGLDIIPVPDLHTNRDISGYLTADRSAIMVDAYCCDHREGTFRYTLAHELAHLELHADLWERLRFENAAEWRDAIASVLTDEQYSAIEWQANAFAGLVLVPGSLLCSLFEEEVPSIVETAAQYRGSQPQTCFDVCLQVICERMARRFVVHPLTVGVRCDYDGLSDEFAVRLLGPPHGLVTRGRLHERG